MPGIDTLSDTERTRRLVLDDCTGRIVAAYLGHNPMPDGPLAELRRIVREALADAADPSNSVQPGVETVMSSSLGPFPRRKFLRAERRRSASSVRAPGDRYLPTAVGSATRDGSPPLAWGWRSNPKTDREIIALWELSGNRLSNC
jgi:hypothetical protein